MEPGADAVDDVGRGYGEPWRRTTSAEEVDDVVMRDSEGEGRSSAPTGGHRGGGGRLFRSCGGCSRQHAYAAGTERVQCIWVLG